MATAVATSIALQGKAFLRGEDRMAVGDRATEAHCCSPHLMPSRSSVAVKRWAALASFPAPGTIGSITASTSVCEDPFFPRLVVGADRPRRGKHHPEEGRRGGEPVSPEKLDEWMRESVSEIVRNIGEAPFLVHVFSNNQGPAGVTLQREAADVDSWPHIRGRWSTGAALPPDGVILVEELQEGGEEDDRQGEAAGSWDHEHARSCGGSAISSSSSSSSSSRTWGVLVQGRGTDVAACYILNTCRVRSSFGFCTHFCLAKAKCFGDTADVQLRNSWLLG